MTDRENRDEETEEIPKKGKREKGRGRYTEIMREKNLYKESEREGGTGIQR